MLSIIANTFMYWQPNHLPSLQLTNSF